MNRSDVSLSAGLASRHVRMPPEEAAALAAARYGLSGAMRRFDTEKDDTFRIATADRGGFVLKVANPDEPVDEIDLQTSLLEHVARADPSLPVPRIVATLDGENGFLHRDEAGQLRHVRLLTFLDGTPLSDTGSTGPEREKVGEILARLRLATAGFEHPADGRVLPWDVKHLSALSGLLVHVDDPRQRDALQRGLERFAGIEPRLAGCRIQVLHNDFSRSNIVVDHDRPEFVTGIIDFGDAVRTAIAIDVSTALLNQLPPVARDDLFLEGRDVLRGYLRHADLLDEERALVPHLVMGRVIARALLTIWRARLIPENSRYILRNTEQGWSQLGWFLARSVDEVSAQLMGAP